MSQPHPDLRIEALLDKQAIAETLVRYCRAIDRRDPVLLRSVYWPDGSDDHGVFSGNAHAFVDFIMDYLTRMRRTAHAISNPTIKLDGERAIVESYVTAVHDRDGPDGPEDYVVGGRYLDVFERRDGEWRILSRRFVEDWNQARRSTPRRSDNPGDRRSYGVAGAGDPSCHSPFDVLSRV